MEFQLFLFSFVLGLVFHKNDLPDERFFAQRHSCMKLSCLSPLSFETESYVEL